MLHVGWFSGRIGVTDAAECETRGPEIRRKNSWLAPMELGVAASWTKTKVTETMYTPRKKDERIKTGEEKTSDVRTDLAFAWR